MSIRRLTKNNFKTLNRWRVENILYDNYHYYRDIYQEYVNVIMLLFPLNFG